jgi:hypothetical protein
MAKVQQMRRNRASNGMVEQVFKVYLTSAEKLQPFKALQCASQVGCRSQATGCCQSVDAQP